MYYSDTNPFSERNIKRAQRSVDQYIKVRNQVEKRQESKEKRDAKAAGLEYVDTKRIKLSLLANNRVCLECSSTDIQLDKLGGYYACAECGALAEHSYFADGADYSTQRLRSSSPYNFMYHFNEVWTAYHGKGPRVEPDDFIAICRYILDTRIQQFTARRYVVDLTHTSSTTLNPLRMQRPHFHQMCKELGLPMLAERWVQIKKRLCGEHFQMQYPSSEEEDAIRVCFARFGRVFLENYYRSGKKRTSKDNVTNNDNMLSRHNLPHFSYIIQCVSYYLDPGMRQRYSFDLYFPLPKTRIVVRRLRLLWLAVCRKLNWPSKLLPQNLV